MTAPRFDLMLFADIDALIRSTDQTAPEIGSAFSAEDPLKIYVPTKWLIAHVSKNVAIMTANLEKHRELLGQEQIDTLEAQIAQRTAFVQELQATEAREVYLSMHLTSEFTDGAETEDSWS